MSMSSNLCELVRMMTMCRWSTRIHGDPQCAKSEALSEDKVLVYTAARLTCLVPLGPLTVNLRPNRA